MSGKTYKDGAAAPVESHHVWGRANSPIEVVIPTDVHRVLHASNGARCTALKHPRSDPLHAVALVLATLADAADAVAAYARCQQWDAWIVTLAEALGAGARSGADWLLIAAGRLEEVHGPDWPAELGMPLFDALRKGYRHE
jgi:hypothetical protein